MAAVNSPALNHWQKVRSWARSPARIRATAAQTMAPRTAAQATISTARRGKKRPKTALITKPPRGKSRRE